MEVKNAAVSVLDQAESPDKKPSTLHPSAQLAKAGSASNGGMSGVERPS